MNGKELNSMVKRVVSGSLKEVGGGDKFTHASAAYNGASSEYESFLTNHVNLKGDSYQ